MNNLSTPQVNQRSVRYGYHWAVARQFDRIGKGMNAGRDVHGQILYLKSLAHPLMNEKDQLEWLKIRKDHRDRIIELVSSGRNVRRKDIRNLIQQLRWSQMDFLAKIFVDKGVLVDEGIPIESIELLEGQI